MNDALRSHTGGQLLLLEVAFGVGIHTGVDAFLKGFSAGNRFSIVKFNDAPLGIICFMRGIFLLFIISVKINRRKLNLKVSKIIQQAFFVFKEKL